MHVRRFCSGALLGAVLGWTVLPAIALPPTEAWLRYYGLQQWQQVLDLDRDGFSVDEEFNYGTDPLDPKSHPPRFEPSPSGVDFLIQVPAGVVFGQAQLQTSTDLQTWEPVPGFPPAQAGVFALPANPGETARFFRFGAPGLLNSDGDCLLDFEELNLFHTDPLKTDTDGDGLDDCAEVNLHHTDPTHSSPTGRGAISGKVMLDEDKDPDTQSHPGIANWRVFADLDFDGEWDASEPSAISKSDGSYLIAELDPGFYRVSLAPQPVWVQIFPTAIPTPNPDGFPDRIVEVFDSGKGPIPFPYGRYASTLPGLRVIVPSPPPDPVEASIILGPLPPPPIAGPFGGWEHVDILAIPTNSFVTVAFDGEEIVDGPGPDLALWAAAGAPEDSAEIFLGATATNLVSIGTFPQAETVPIDLNLLGITWPVRYVKVRGVGMLGTYPGFDLVGIEALHYRPLTRGNYDVTVQGGQTISGVDFGVTGDDRPPKVLLSADPWDIRAGESLSAQVTVTDDVGIGGVQLTANGAPVALDGLLRGSVQVANGGLLTLEATATDTASQRGGTLLTLIARNSDGSLPDLSGLTANGGSAGGGPSLQILSPVSGEILASSRQVVGSISGSKDGLASWKVEYAPADLVNPEALDAFDSDYVLLSEGTATVFNGNLGTLPGDTLPSGAYFLRVSASDTRGITSYLGYVFGVRIDPLDLRPEIVLTSPTNESIITYQTDLHGTISTRQQLREWYVEYSPLRNVNLQNLGDNSPPWIRIASGTNTVQNGLLARFDPTLLPNDAYVLRVSAWNRNGQGWADAVVVQVTGSAKLGNFAVEFTDVELALAGIPIVVKRAYNSLNAPRSGDFGYGWSLAIQDADIAETVPQVGAGLGSTPFKIGTRVYLTAPDGKRVGFSFQPEVGALSFLGTAFRAVFTPDPGVAYKLSVPEGDSAFLSVNALGEAGLFFIPLPWNPDTYILTDPKGTRYTYDQREGLIEVIDVSGNRVAFTPEGINHSSGQRIQFTRDSAGRITQMQVPGGETWRYQYDTNGDLAQVIYPGSIVATLGYSQARPHFLETINDPFRGPSLRTEYDDLGRVTATIDAAGNRREQAWDPGTFSGTITDARGNVTKLTYDALGNLVRREDPMGGVTAWEFRDARHPNLPTAVTDARGHRSGFTYDAAGNVLTMDRPFASHRFTYDTGNRLTKIQYGTGLSEEFNYDSAGHLIESKSLAGNLQFTYSAGGLLTSILDEEGGMTRLEYDSGWSMPTRIILPDGNSKRFTYDSSGRLLSYTDPLGAMTRYEYDASGRRNREIDPAGAATLTTYDPAFPQLKAAETDRAGRVTRYAYDSFGRQVQKTGPGGALTRYEYDADGNRTAVVDPLGNRYEFRYDALSRLVEEIDPVGKKKTHVYDAAGNRIEVVDRLGRKREFSYDAHNRLSQEEWRDPVTDALVRTMTFTYDRIDRPATFSDLDASIEFGPAYLPGAPVPSEEARYNGAPARRIAFTSDAAFRRAGVSVMTTSPTLEPALSIDYTRDLSGRLWIVSSHNPLPPSTLSGLAFQLQLWRNARGEVTELRRFADLGGTRPVSHTTYTYSGPCGCWLDRVDHVVATNQPLAAAASVYTRDAEGEILAIREGADSSVFSHDAAGQLIGATRNGLVTESYLYDANGNRTSSHRHPDYVTGVANRLNQAGPWSLAYDHEGNLLTKSNAVTGVHFQFLWDHRNRLTRVQREDPNTPGNSVVIQYRYDPLDRRIAVIRDGQTTWTYFDGQQPLVDFIGQETTPVAVHYSGEKLDELYALWRRGEGLHWVLTDHLGTPRRVLNTNGVEVAFLQYDSFGNPLSVSGTSSNAPGRFAFAGREWEPDTGLYYNRARYYDPELGRFLQEDPLGFAAGDPNLYRYVFNRPLTITDPTGKLSATEYAQLMMAMARPGNFCQFALCVNSLWTGVANSVINLTPSGKPNAACAANLVGVPATGFDLGVAAAKLGLEAAKLTHPALDLLGDLAICAISN